MCGNFLSGGARRAPVRGGATSTRASAAMGRRETVVVTLDADQARARAASRAREGESVALRKCLLANGDALEAVFVAAAPVRPARWRVGGVGESVDGRIDNYETS